MLILKALGEHFERFEELKILTKRHVSESYGRDIDWKPSTRTGFYDCLTLDARYCCTFPGEVKRCSLNIKAGFSRLSSWQVTHMLNQPQRRATDLHRYWWNSLVWVVIIIEGVGMRRCQVFRRNNARSPGADKQSTRLSHESNADEILHSLPNFTYFIQAFLTYLSKRSRTIDTNPFMVRQHRVWDDVFTQEKAAAGPRWAETNKTLTICQIKAMHDR